MTRINVVPVTELSDQMLGAEYRELPRVVGLARGAAFRGEKPGDYMGSGYTLGPGHVQFFYPRLLWVIQRYDSIVRECTRRGRKVNYPFLDTSGIPPEWFNSWRAPPEALELNRQRLKIRGNYKQARTRT